MLESVAPLTSFSFLASFNPITTLKQDTEPEKEPPREERTRENSFIGIAREIAREVSNKPCPPDTWTYHPMGSVKNPRSNQILEVKHIGRPPWEPSQPHRRKRPVDQVNRNRCGHQKHNHVKSPRSSENHRRGPRQSR